MQTLFLEPLESRTLLSFQGAMSFDAAGSEALAAGDFRGDGHTDLVTARSGFASSVNLLLGNGDGTFQAPRSFSIVEQPRAIVAGDFRHDGRLDVAVAGVEDVVVLLGNGDGTFQNPVYYFTGIGWSIATGDFRSDGHTDLAITNRSQGLVGVLLGNGDGTFQNVRYSAAGTDPNGIAVGDFNQDGRDDIAVTNSRTNQVSILLSNGDGTFQPPVPYSVGNNPTAAIVSNFTKSGHRDLAVADSGNSQGAGAGLSVLLGNGDGTFGKANTMPVGLAPVALAAAEFRGDSVQDLAVVGPGTFPGGLGDSSIKVLLGNGDGTFQTPVGYLAAAFGASLAVGNFHNNGNLDIAVLDRGTVSVLAGIGDGTFVSAESIASNLGPHAVAVGDLNRDGNLDFVAANFESVSVYLGNGDGTFQPPATIPLRSSVGSVALADLRHKGILDLVVIDGFGIEVLLGNGNGTFQAPVTYTVAANFPAHVEIADVNNDGFPDLIALGTRGMVNVWLNNGDGTFGTPSTVTLPGNESPTALAVGDFHHTGFLDILLAASRSECDPKYGCTIVSSSLNVFKGNGDGTFQAPVRQDVLRLASPPSFLRVGDFNGDGLPDLVFGAHILLNNGDGTFRDAGTFNTGSRIVNVALADVNLDGNLDIIAVNAIDTISVLLGNGDGTFQPAVNYAVGPLPSGIAAGDFNGDNFPDLITANEGGRGSFTLLLNAADWPGSAPGRSSQRSQFGTRLPARELATFGGGAKLPALLFEQPPVQSVLSPLTVAEMDPQAPAAKRVDKFFIEDEPQYFPTTRKRSDGGLDEEFEGFTSGQMDI